MARRARPTSSGSTAAGAATEDADALAVAEALGLGVDPDFGGSSHAKRPSAPSRMTLEATRFAAGRKNQMRWEINGSKGSLVFDAERQNELLAHFSGSTPGASAQGFRNVLVSEADHPYWEHWWPQGHMIGWENLFVHEVAHFLGAVTGAHEVAPIGATFEDGYQAALVCDAIEASSSQGCRVPVSQMA